MNITILLNGVVYELSGGSTVYDLIILKKWLLVPKIIRINGTEILPQAYRETELKAGQDVRIIPQFGGG